MKTWQQQGTGKVNKQKHMWRWWGNRKVDNFAGRMWNKDKDKYFRNLVYNHGEGYDFVGWQLIRDDEVGVLNNFDDSTWLSQHNFYTINYAGTLLPVEHIKLWDKETGYNANASKGHLYMLYRIFRVGLNDSKPADAEVLIPDSALSIKHNAGLMSFLWKYPIPGYKAVGSRLQYRFRNMYKAGGGTDGDTDADDNVIEGGVFPFTKPTANHICVDSVLYPGYGEMRAGWCCTVTQYYVDGPNYAVRYNYNWTWDLRLLYNESMLVPPLPRDKQSNYIYRGFNKWIVDQNSVFTAPGGIQFKDNTYKYYVQGFTIIGA